MERAQRTLTLLQHVLLGVLTVVCAIRAVTAGVNVWAQLGLSVGLLLAYVLGVRGRWRSAGWLLGLTVIWLGLVVLSHENVWIAFSLWLLAGQLLTLRVAIGYVTLTLAVVVAAPFHTNAGLTAAEILGPTIGAAFALFVSRGQVELVREAHLKQQLVDSLVESQAETEALHAELAAAQREFGARAERTRLSGDIHDTLAQGFSSIVLLARAGRGADEAGLRNLVDQIESTASDGLGQAREVVAALAPADLAETGLPAALTRLAQALEEQTGIGAEVSVDGDPTGLPTTVEVALLRTAQGALANVRQHAAASRVVVSLTGTEDEVRLDIADDGIGFDPDRAITSGPATGGYGLTAGRTRLRELGGSLEVESEPGAGATVTAHVPLRGHR